MAITLSQDDIDKFSDNGATLYLNDNEAADGDEVEEGDELKAVAQEGYTFFSEDDLGNCDDAPSNADTAVGLEGGYDPVTGGNAYHNFDINSDRTEATLDFPNESSNNGFWVCTEYSEPEPDYEVTQDDLDAVGENATLYVNDEEAEVGTEVFHGDTLKIECAENWLFYDDYENSDENYTGASVYIEAYDPGAGETTYESFDLSEDRKEATYTWEGDIPLEGDNGSNLKVYQKQESDFDTVGFNFVYKITEDNLKDVNKERFVLATDGEFDDYGQFILGAIQIPTQIPERYIQEEENIRLGDEETDIKAPRLSNDKIALDLGKIEVPKEFEDSRDYTNTVCNLYLPNASSIELDPIYVIGETIEVEYIVDVYSGDATINIYSSKLGEYPFETKTTNLGISIPYRSTQSFKEPENLGIEVGGINWIKKPYIEIVRKEAHLANELFSASVTDEGELKNQEGYIVVENIRLETEATEEEASQIESVLQNGVIL